MFLKNFYGKRFPLNLPTALHPGTFQAEIKPADASKETAKG